MEDQVNYENKIEALTTRCDTQIEELRACAKQATPELKKKIDQEISQLIANREALRRGLLRLNEEGEFCSSCPD